MVINFAIGLDVLLLGDHLSSELPEQHVLLLEVSPVGRNAEIELCSATLKQVLASNAENNT